MRFAMLAKPELWWVVTGEFRRPEMRNDEVTKTRSSSADDKLARQLKHWQERNGQALSFIARSIAPYLWHLIRNKTGARQAWLALENHFKPCLPQLVLRLQTAWRDLRQKPGTDSFTKFVDDIQDLAAKLDVVGQRVTEIDKAEALVKGIRPDMTSMAYSVKWKLEDAYEDERRAHQNHVRHRYIFDDAVRILRVEDAKLPLSLTRRTSRTSLQDRQYLPEERDTNVAREVADQTLTMAPRRPLSATSAPRIILLSGAPTARQGPRSAELHRLHVLPEFNASRIVGSWPVAPRTT